MTGSRHLVLAGGVALNCVANGKILEAGLFDDIWIQPAAGDAGGAVGAAYAVWHIHRGHEPRTEPEPCCDAMSGALSRARVLGARQIERTHRALRRAAPSLRGLRARSPPTSPRGWPPARSAAGSRGAWSSGRARSATAASSAIRAIPRCRRS